MGLGSISPKIGRSFTVALMDIRATVKLKDSENFYNVFICPLVANKRGHHALLLRERRWRLDLLPPFAIQRVKKRHQIVFLLIRQIERND